MSRGFNWKRHSEIGEFQTEFADEDGCGVALLDAPEQEESLYGDAATAKDFAMLAAEWRKATAYVSSTTKRVTHPAYLKIIGLGEAAVPLLLEELQARPALWFHALHVITGQNPVPPEQRGKVREMARSWIEWGKANGFVD